MAAVVDDRVLDHFRKFALDMQLVEGTTSNRNMTDRVCFRTVTVRTDRLFMSV